MSGLRGRGYHTVCVGGVGFFNKLSPLGTVLPPMLGVHALIGIGEGVITAAAVSAVMVSRSDLLPATN